MVSHTEQVRPYPYPKGNLPALPHEDFIITFKSNPRLFKHHGKKACHIDALICKDNYWPFTRRYRTRVQGTINNLMELHVQLGTLENVKVYFNGILSKPEVLENPNIPLPEYPTKYATSYLLKGKGLSTSIKVVKIDKEDGPTSTGYFGITNTQYLNAEQLLDQFYVIFDSKNNKIYGAWHSDIASYNPHTELTCQRPYYMAKVGWFKEISAKHQAVRLLKEQN